MRKKFLIIVILLIVIIAGVLIIFNRNNKNIEINILELANRISQSNAFEDELAEAEKEIVISEYDFDENKIKEIVSYQGSGATSEEIVILQLNAKNDLNEIKQKIDNRLTERKEVFESYLPKEVSKIDNKILKIVNNYIILCISNNQDEVNNIINDYIK